MSATFLHCVYILRSIPHPKQTYIGYTHDLKTRLAQHNAGKSAHTSKFAPWSLGAPRKMAARRCFTPPARSVRTNAPTVVLLRTSADFRERGLAGGLRLRHRNQAEQREKFARAGNELFDKATQN